MISYKEKYLKYKNKYFNLLQKGGANLFIKINDTKFLAKNYQAWAYRDFLRSYNNKIYISQNHHDYNDIIKNNSNYQILTDQDNQKFTISGIYPAINFITETNEIRQIIIDSNGNIKILIDGQRYDLKDYQLKAYQDFIKKEIQYATFPIPGFISIPVNEGGGGDYKQFTIKYENDNIVFKTDDNKTYIFEEQRAVLGPAAVGPAAVGPAGPRLIEHPLTVPELHRSIKSDDLIEFNNAILLYKTYFHDYAFPSWILNYTKWLEFKFNDTLVIYDHENDTDLDEVKKLVKEREPVNVNMNRSYYGQLLKDTFGYDTSYYIRSYNQRNTLSKNIAIYCRALVKYNGNEKLIHVINLIGYGFDNIEQPDYKYYKTMNIVNVKNDLILKYRKVWLKACIVAKKLNLTNILLFNVGGGFFADKLSEFGINNFTNDILIPCLSDNNIHPNIITPDLFCRINNINLIKDVLRGTDYRIPQVLFSGQFNEVTTLFVNAWDPHSLLGNGNESDSSLDGWWGRISNISVLGSSLTNKQIKYIGINY